MGNELEAMKKALEELKANPIESNDGEAIECLEEEIRALEDTYKERIEKTVNSILDD